MNSPDESPYGIVDEEGVFAIPTQAIKGRSGPSGRGKTFAGYIDANTGLIRVDCDEEPSFWLEIDLSAINAIRYAPGGHGYESAKADFEVRVVSDKDNEGDTASP